MPVCLLLAFFYEVLYPNRHKVCVFIYIIEALFPCNVGHFLYVSPMLVHLLLVLTQNVVQLLIVYLAWFDTIFSYLV